MIAVLGTNIISPLGLTSQENYSAVKRGLSPLAELEGYKGIPGKITASVFNSPRSLEKRERGFEAMATESIAAALETAGIDPSSDRTLFVLSTTKADIDSLSPDNVSRYRGPAEIAKSIACHFNIVTEPVVVCNACISGCNAQLVAARLIAAGKYDNAIVCGADTVSTFTTAGFLSFKALSPFECRPFDIERLGLNLGEAAATMIIGRRPGNGEGLWILEDGSLTNDAYHVSAPSPDGDGVFRALSSVTEGFSPDDFDCISLHGTATMFNDQMESKAVQKAGLSEVPATALKGYYGHTLGAAGLVETIITMKALEDGVILPTRGFSEMGVSGKVSVSDKERPGRGKGRFIKVLSGFGGCNCALRFSNSRTAGEFRPGSGRMNVLSRVSLDSGDSLEDIYRTRLESYPKFHKMDMLAKLSYVASELVLKECPAVHPDAIILFNSTSSILQDLKHIGTIGNPEEFFPSPSIFLYTLPNLAVGEIAIRDNIKGETSLYILDRKNPGLMDSIVEASVPRGATVLTGWVDCSAEDSYEADLKLVTIE